MVSQDTFVEEMLLKEVLRRKEENPLNIIRIWIKKNVIYRRSSLRMEIEEPCNAILKAFNRNQNELPKDLMKQAYSDTHERNVRGENDKVECKPRK
jgi:hypothetical protein